MSKLQRNITAQVIVLSADCTTVLQAMRPYHCCSEDFMSEPADIVRARYSHIASNNHCQPVRVVVDIVDVHHVKRVYH